MSDLLERLRRVENGDGTGNHVTHWYRNPDGPEAAAEIARLRLTDAEREAVKWCRDNIIPMSSSASAFAFIHTATLRKLLERLR